MSTRKTSDDWDIRKAGGRDDVDSVRVSIPSETAAKAGIETGDRVVVIEDGDGSVRVIPVRDYFTGEK